jgi:hypothetical protein
MSFVHETVYIKLAVFYINLLIHDEVGNNEAFIVFKSKKDNIARSRMLQVFAISI